MKKYLLTSALIVAVSLTASANASSWYVGAGLGGADANDLCQGAPTKYCDDQGAALRGFLGLRVNRGFAVEAVLDAAVGFITPGARAAGYDGNTTAWVLGVNAIGFIPLGSRVSLYGGVSGAFGYATTRTSDHGSRSYNSSSGSDCHVDWFDDDWDTYCSSGNSGSSYDDGRYRSDPAFAAGGLIGVEVQVVKRFLLRAQAQRYLNVDGGLAFGERRDLDLITVNALFAFH